MGTFPVLDSLSGWRLAPEPPLPGAACLQAVLIMSLLDEITGLPPAPAPTATTTTAGLAACATAGGYAGLAGRPLTRFLPGFAAGAPLQITLAGPGYLTRAVEASVEPQAGYPDSFVPVDLGSVGLHRAPVTVIGRVVSDTQAALAGALVSLDGIWLTLAALANPAAAPNLIALLSPLYADRPAAASVAVQSLTAAPAAEAKTLLRPGNAGDGSIRLSDQAGLAAGTIIALTPQDTARTEYLTVTAITDGGVPPNQPATVALAFPLARPHPAGGTVIRMIPGAAGAANSLSSAAAAGDVTVFPATMTGLDSAMQAVVISGGGAADEYHPASLYAGTSDSDGHVVLPPVHRVAQLRLRVHDAAQPSDLLQVAILPFGADTLTLDLAFP